VANHILVTPQEAVTYQMANMAHSLQYSELGGPTAILKFQVL
jgi:hypothetical protein